MTVPPSFRRHGEIPAVLVLHCGTLSKNEIEEREGYAVARPGRAIVDLIVEELVSTDIIQQAYWEAKQRGLIMDGDFNDYRKNLKIERKMIECLPDLK